MAGCLGLGVTWDNAVIHLLQIKSSHPIASFQVSSGNFQQQLFLQEHSTLSVPPAHRGRRQLSDPVLPCSLPSDKSVGTLTICWC